MDRDPLPRDFDPSKSICCSVGLEGDFKTLTREEGEHGWAVTKLISYRSEKVAVSVFSPSIETKKLSLAGYDSRSGARWFSWKGVTTISARGVG